MSARQVPFLNYPFLFSSQQQAYTELITDVQLRGAFIMQRGLVEFGTALVREICHRRGRFARLRA